MSFIMRPIRFASTGHIIQGSGLFDGSSGYLSRTPGTAGNDAVGTVSFICKRGPIGVAQHIISCGVAATRSQINFSNEGTGGRLEFATVEGGLQTKLQVETLRDLSAYYHFVISWNTDDTTAATRYRFYQWRLARCAQRPSSHHPRREHSALCLPTGEGRSVVPRARFPVD